MNAISPELARLLSGTTQAVWLSRQGTLREGYLCFATRPGTADHVVGVGTLPLGTATVHELVAEDVLSSVRHDSAGAVLAEWARVVCDGGHLRLTVPNFEAVAELLADGRSAELRRLLYGGRRFGEDGMDEATSDAWSPEELEHTLAGVGFVVEEIDAGTMITLSARRAAVTAKRATGEVPPVCVLVTSTGGADALLGRLRALCGTDAGVDFETVVLVNGPDEASRALVAALEGDVTTATSPVVLDPAAAFDEAARFARADTIVALSPRARPVDGWLAPPCRPSRRRDDRAERCCSHPTRARLSFMQASTSSGTAPSRLSTPRRVLVPARRDGARMRCGRRRRRSRGLRLEARSLGGAPRPCPGVVGKRRCDRLVPPGALIGPALRRCGRLRRDSRPSGRGRPESRASGMVLGRAHHAASPTGTSACRHRA